MAVRKVLRMGHPVLRRPADPIDPAAIESFETRLLIADMIDTLHDYGGIGLAAPQVGESVRIAIVEIPESGTRYGDVPEMPLTVFFNPTITVLETESRGFWEGCLSVPGLRGFVERPQKVRVDYLDIDGNPRAIELEGFVATVFQHEFDHLDGKLYVDRITDMRLLAFEEEFLRYLAPSSDVLD
ncbi:MAG TPA: peptide deformylase [Gammaproteobacteria bacterium]|nr:peptide deformylase [Gammaproteobacteria bacterium]